MSETPKAKFEPMYAIVFYCRDTNELSRKGPYETREEAIEKKANPGYGIEKVVQLNTSEAVAKLIAEQITDMVWIDLMEQNLSPDDENLFYPVFYDYIWEYHDQMQPGYETIPDYMRGKPVPTRPASEVFGN